MGKKRKNRGRGSGRGCLVQCARCGAQVPRDKAKKRTRWVSFIDPVIARELRGKNVFMPRSPHTEYYCISCAVAHDLTRVREKEKRVQRSGNEQKSSKMGHRYN
jgi:ribosomal protein S26